MGNKQEESEVSVQLHDWSAVRDGHTGSWGRTAWEGLDSNLFPEKEQLELLELGLGMGVPVTELPLPQQHLGNAALECINDNFLLQ